MIVDFSKFAGKTLILYNDAPAAFPARVPTYDYYTGAPDLSPERRPDDPARLRPEHPHHHAGEDRRHAAPAPAFNLTKLQATPSATRRTAPASSSPASTRSSSGRPPTTPPTAPASPPAATATRPAARSTAATGYVRINDSTQPTRPGLQHPARRRTPKMTMKLEPKAIHDEMNSTTFDEFGRMHGQPRHRGPAADAGPAERHPLPVREPADRADRRHEPAEERRRVRRNGKPVSDVKITPISSATDGTQIWQITHNGVDTHPIHFHLYDVQVLNRVTWDNIIIPTEPDRARLEGHGPDQPARGHDRRPAADHPRAAVRAAEHHPAAQPDDAAGSTDDVQQHRPAGQPDGRHHQPAGQLRLGVRLPLPHPVATRRWT